MNTHKLFTLIISILLSTGLFASKKVCIVKNRVDAHVSVNRTYNRAIADYVIVITKERHESGSNAWIITEQKDAELKVYISDTPEKIKVFFSENKADGTKHTNYLHNRNTPGVKKSIGGIQKPF